MKSAIQALRRSSRSTQVEFVDWIDGDFSPCSCPRHVRPLGGSRDQLANPDGIEILEVEKQRVRSNGLWTRYRCLSCDIVFLVLRTDDVDVFWPSISRQSPLRNVESWPNGFVEQPPVFTRISRRFVARVATLVDNRGSHGST